MAKLPILPVKKVARILVFVTLLAGCSDDRPEVTGASQARTIDLTLTKKLEETAQLDLWRQCAANVVASDGAAAATRDVAAGEWRFMTYKHYGIAVYTEAPGVSECTPTDVAGQARFARLSQCGEISGYDEDCECQKAKLAYLSAYNRQLLRERPDAIAKNCNATDGPLYSGK